MTTDVIDVTFHGSAFPATYVGDGTIIGSPYYNDGAELLTLNFTSDGNAVSIPVGFQPQEIEVIDVTDLTTWQWNRGLAATNTLKTVAAGTMTLDATSAVSVATFDGRSTVILSAAAFPASKNIIVRVLG